MSVKEGWRGRFFEDFEVGDIYKHPLGRTITTTDNIWFTLLTQNTAPIGLYKAANHHEIILAEPTSQTIQVPQNRANDYDLGKQETQARTSDSGWNQLYSTLES